MESINGNYILNPWIENALAYTHMWKDIVTMPIIVGTLVILMVRACSNGEVLHFYKFFLLLLMMLVHTTLEVPWVIWWFGYEPT